MKKSLLFLLLTSLFSLTSCGEPTTASFTLIELEDHVEIHTQLQIDNFIDKTFDEIKSDTYYAKGEMRKSDCSAPEAIKLKWKVKTDKGNLSSYNVLISENENLENPYILKASKTSVDFYNAKVGTTYYYKVISGKFESEIGSFHTTTDGPRNIYIDGVRNVRDLGGYGYIKQGLLYRGGAFESTEERSLEFSVNITKKGIDTVINQLGIKTEVDVRKNIAEKGWIENCSLTQSTVPGVNYVALPMVYGGHNVLTWTEDNYDNPARFKDFFNLLANSNNYPVYFHCSHGKDRTGGLAYVIEALMGMDEESMFRDYLFSNFASAMDYHMVPTGITAYFGETLEEYLSEQESLTLAERTYRYLKDVVGIPSTTLDSVIEILSV